MPEFTWRNTLNLPSNRGVGWGVYKGGIYHESTAETAKKAALKWLPASPVLFGAPGAHLLMPPTEIVELENSAMLAVRRQYLSVSTVAIGCALAFIAVSFQKPHSILFALGLALACFWVVASVDYFFFLRHRHYVTERALFYYWIRTNPDVRMAGVCSLAFMIFLGGGQLALQYGGGVSTAFHRVGAMYESIENGQYWRLLTGPYLHYSAIHFANNFLMLFIMGSAAYGVVGRHTIYIFIISNFLSILAQWRFGPQFLGSFGGISGGVYALYGVLLGVGLRHKDLFPKGLLLYFLTVGALGVLSTDLVSQKSASVAHFTGFAFGLLYGLIVRLAPRMFSKGNRA